MQHALEYEQISDDLMILDIQSATLRFNVKLLHKTLSGYGESFHKEFKYNSKFINKSVGYSIRRNFTYFLSINGIRNYSNNMPLSITINDMILFKAYITNAYKWITSSDIYAIKNNELVIKGHHDPLIMNTIYNKRIMFEPIIVTKTNDLKTQGIRMTIQDECNNGDWKINIDANTFAGLIYLVDSIDMYNAALSLINYLPRPEFGSAFTTDYSTPLQDNEIERRNDANMEYQASVPLKPKQKKINSIYDL